MTIILPTGQPAAISAIMQAQSAAGFAFRNENYRGALAGEYRLVELLPGARVPAKMLAPAAPLTLIIVGDDGGLSHGRPTSPRRDA
jgi:hypothetical protein